jgi:anti-sigma B factor antagonist
MGSRKITMVPHDTDHAPAGLVLSARGEGGFTIVTISGDIDLASVPMLREQLLAKLQPQASRIIIDLSGVTFCDASGLAVLVAASRQAGMLAGVVRLAALAPLTATVLRVTGLDSRFEIFATVAEAIEAPVEPRVRDAGLPRSGRLHRRDTLGLSRSGACACSKVREAPEAHPGVAMRARRSYVARR